MNKFDLGDVVRGTYDENTVSGQVIIVADARSCALEFDADRINHWSSHYPDWLSGHLYKIWLPKPLKCIKFDDFTEFYDVSNSEEIRKIYDKMVDEIRVLSFYEDELDMIAENGSDVSNKIKTMIGLELVKKNA
jgi:hypothetical protein